jgi:hypothetical protein
MANDNGKKKGGNQASNGKGATKDKAARAEAEANGRARKMVVRQGHTMSREQRFAQLCAKATDDKSIIASAIDGGHEGALVKIVLEKSVPIRVKKTEANPNGIENKVLTGTIVLEVASVDWGYGPKPVLYVIESDFSPIPRGGQLFLPLMALANPKWCSPFSDERADWQEELREALQWACARELEARRQTYLARKHTKGAVLGVTKPAALPPAPVMKGQMDAALAVVDEQPVVVPIMARALKMEHIAGKAKHWTGGYEFFVSAGSRGLAYFTRTVDGGAKKLIFHKASDEHPLAALLDEHKAIMVDIDPILKEGYEPTSGDMHDVRVARVVMQNYLREHFRGIPLTLREVVESASLASGTPSIGRAAMAAVKQGDDQ